LAIAVEQDPYIIIIQKAIPAVNDRLRIMTGIIQNRQATHAQALYALEDLLTTRIEQRIEGIAGALSDFVGGSFHFVPRGQLAPALAAAPASAIGACPLPGRPVALPITALAQAAEAPQYRMSRTI
jgi:hypothetical protein